jgi:mRNA interferase HigB
MLLTGYPQWGNSMRVISRRPLREFATKHPPAKAPLDAWFAEARTADWSSFTDVKAAFGSADVVAGNRVIFNIGGNKYRLIVKVAYKSRTIFVRFVGTHAEYDKIDAATV